MRLIASEPAARSQHPLKDLTGACHPAAALQPEPVAIVLDLVEPVVPVRDGGRSRGDAEINDAVVHDKARAENRNLERKLRIQTRTLSNLSGAVALFPCVSRPVEAKCRHAIMREGESNA